MVVNTALMLVYVTKFFWWEAGYWNTMDIAHDRGLFMLPLVRSFFCLHLFQRFFFLLSLTSTIQKICFFIFSAGFYICWGCLVWVPSVYTSPGMYLVNHPVNLGVQVLNDLKIYEMETNYLLFHLFRQ